MNIREGSTVVTQQFVGEGISEKLQPRNSQTSADSTPVPQPSAAYMRLQPDRGGLWPLERAGRVSECHCAIVAEHTTVANDNHMIT